MCVFVDFKRVLCEGGTSVAGGNLLSARFYAGWGCFAFRNIFNMQCGCLYVSQGSFKVSSMENQAQRYFTPSTWTENGWGNKQHHILCGLEFYKQFNSQYKGIHLRVNVFIFKIFHYKSNSFNTCFHTTPQRRTGIWKKLTKVLPHFTFSTRFLPLLVTKFAKTCRSHPQRPMVLFALYTLQTKMRKQCNTQARMFTLASHSEMEPKTWHCWQTCQHPQLWSCILSISQEDEQLYQGFPLSCLGFV